LGFLKYFSSVKGHHGQIKCGNTAPSVTVTDIKASLQSLLETIRQNEALKGNLFCSQYQSLDLQWWKVTSRHQHHCVFAETFKFTYSVSVTSNYPSKATMNNGVLGYLWNIKDIISSMTRTTESE